MFKFPRITPEKQDGPTNSEAQDLHTVAFGVSKSRLWLAALAALTPGLIGCGISSADSQAPQPESLPVTRVDDKQARALLTERMNSFEKLDISKHEEEFCSIAKAIDSLPRGSENVSLAQNLAYCAMWGRTSPATMQIVATTLENALRNSPISLKNSQEMYDYSPYCTLAMLSRYENKGVRVALEQPQYHAAMKYLEEMDSETAKIRFVFKDSNGKQLSPKDYTGKPVVINFWAPGCMPCLKEMPALSKLSGQFGSSVSFLGIATFDEDKRVRDYLSKHDTVKFPVVIQQSGDLAVKLGVGTIPATIVLDSHGKVFWRGSGTRSAERFQEVIEAALSH